MEQLYSIIRNVNIYIILLLLFTCVTSPKAQVLSTEKIYENVLPSIMTLSIQKESESISIGTAFLIKEDGVAVTCFHVVEDAISVKAKFPDGEEYFVSGIIDKDEKRDIALIRVKCFRENFLTIIADEPKVGSQAFVIGAPRGLEFSISDGIISQVQDLVGMKNYQFTCPVSPGNSGSPLINSQGNVIGVVSWQIVEGQNLNFAIPSKYILGLDASLPTTPFDLITSSFESIGTNDLQVEFDNLLAKILMGFGDSIVSLAIAVQDQKLPLFFYSSLMDLKSDLEIFNSGKVKDKSREIIKDYISSSGYNLIQALELYRKMYLTEGRVHEDYFGQSVAFANQYVELRKEFFNSADDPLVNYESFSSDAFKNSLTTDYRVFYKPEAKDVFRLGVRTLSNDPMTFLIITPNSLAEELRLKPNDKVISIDGEQIPNVTFMKLILNRIVGQFVEFEILRNGELLNEVIEIPDDLYRFSYGPVDF